MTTFAQIENLCTDRGMHFLGHGGGVICQTKITTTFARIEDLCTDRGMHFLGHGGGVICNLILETVPSLQ